MSQNIYIVLVQKESTELCKIIKYRIHRERYDNYSIIYTSYDLHKAYEFYNNFKKRKTNKWRDMAKYLIHTELDKELQTGLLNEEIIRKEEF